jgi:hypothetical protein
MKVRPYQPKDEAILREFHVLRGYGDSFPTNIADFQVAVDEQDFPIMAAGTKLVPEVTLICTPSAELHPLVKLKGIAMLHEAIRCILSAGNHTEAFAFLAPSIEQAFGRHLVKHFGWRETWKSYAIRIERP